MRYRYARKLHNSDEVTHKKTRRVCRVVNTLIRKKIVLVSIIHPTQGFMEVPHVDVR